MGNQNALRHGYYAREAIEARQRARELVRQVKDTRQRLEEMELADPAEWFAFPRTGRPAPEA